MMKRLFFLFIIILAINTYSLGSCVIFSDYFNGPHPGSWQIGYDDSYSNRSWGWPYGYAYMFCEPTGPEYWYANNLDLSMERRNIDLSGYTTAALTFNYIVDTESYYDYFAVKVKDQNGTWQEMFRESGTHSLVWVSKTINLDQFAGQSGITIQFYFHSDYSICGSDSGYEGVFVDNVSLTAGGSRSLSLISPNGGESLTAGSNHDITWSSNTAMGTVKIEYSVNNGSSWTPIVSSTPNDGSYTWAVPDISSSQCLVRIRWTPDCEHSWVTGPNFPITPITITVTSPNGGEKWVIGSAYFIRWASTGSVGNVKIEYSTDNGSHWTTIAPSTPNDGSHPWVVPDSLSTQCLVRIQEASDGVPSDTSNSPFTIDGGDIIVTSPNGGESMIAGTTQNITWNSGESVGNIKIEYSTDNGGHWATIVSSTDNDGTYSWTVPNTPSTECIVRIKEAADGDPSDTSDSVFSILSPFTVTYPNGGESLDAGATPNITWDSRGSAENVKIEYSTDNGSSWTVSISSTKNDGAYSWTVPNTASDQCLVKISDAANSSLYDKSDKVFTIIYIPSKIVLNRTRLNFGATTNGIVTNPQDFLITNGGGGTLTWNVSDNANWLGTNPASGTTSGIVSAFVYASGLSPGVYTAAITVTDPGATNSPQIIDVILTVFSAGRDASPFGSFATPQDGSTVRSSVAVTGWVLDDIGVEKVEILRGNWVEDPGGDRYWEEKFIGNAVFVEGARPDVEIAYPGYPMNYQAGWGYMMLTNFLPNQGNGNFVIIAKAVDKTGKKVTLGEKAIYCDNRNAVKPFGAIDTPAAGGTASGTNYRNQGWVLTPLPNRIPEDGSTIRVYIDGINRGNTGYNVYRADIANFFPGYANSNGALAFFDFDTTEYANGVHTIQWTATDNAGNTDGIGSRYFTIRNLEGTGRQASGSTIQCAGTTRYTSIKELSGIPVGFAEPVYIEKGLTPGTVPQVIVPDENGVINIEIKELERIAVLLFDNKSADSKITGCLKVGDRLNALPIGSTLDTKNAVFYWQPGPGFTGEYRFIFIENDKNELKKINVKILPATFE